MLWLRVQLESFPVPTGAAFSLELSLTDALFSRRADTVELEKLLLFFLPPPPALDGEGRNSLMMKPAPSIEGVFFRQGLVLEELLAVVNLTELFSANPSVVVALLDSDSSLRSRSDSS